MEELKKEMHTISINSYTISLSWWQPTCSIITECSRNSIYRDWTCLKWRPVHKVYRSVHVKRVVQSSQSYSGFTYNYIAKLPSNSPNLSCSRAIPLQKKCPFCYSFFCQPQLVNKRRQKFTIILHFTWGCAFLYLDTIGVFALLPEVKWSNSCTYCCISKVWTYFTYGTHS